MSIRAIKPEPVEIEGLDKPRALLYDLAAFAYLEERFPPIEVDEEELVINEDTEQPEIRKTGRKVTLYGVQSAMERLQQDSFVALGAFIYAGLMHEVRQPLGQLPGGRYAGEKLTEEMVGRMLTPGMVADLQEPLEAALKAATESGERPTEAPQEAPTTTTMDAGTGLGSTTPAPSSSDEPTQSSGA